MNDYLVSIGENLENEFRNTNACPQNYYVRDPLPNEYVITKEDVIASLKEIDSSKGSGIDFIPTFIIKDAFNSIPLVIAHLMNQSLKTAIFPDKWALASVTPIPKAGDSSNVSNWRPISILPLPGKLLEKICTRLLIMELNANSILSPFQFGFRAGLPTSHAIFHYVKNIIDGINNKKITASIYLDFARAFDSVNYLILLDKLRDMGMSDTLRNWIKGYLANRQICTKFNGFVSPAKKLRCGVPQGSVIGPILFLCYINDIVEIAHRNEIQISLYADDAVIYFTSDSQPLIEVKLQTALNEISLWCRSNHIKLNVKKTKLCCYGTRHNLGNYKIQCNLNDSLLPISKQYTYLGIILDDTMTLESNFNATFKKFSYKIFQFSKICKYLPTDARVLVYKQAILPLVEYVCYLMYLNRKHDIDKLQKLQNRALRLCYNIGDPRTISVHNLHVQANLSTLDQRREKQLLGLMYDISRKREFLRPILMNTRQAEKITLDYEISRCGIYAHSPYVIGCGLWNNLDASIQKAEQRSIYKTKIKDLYRTH